MANPLHEFLNIKDKPTITPALQQPELPTDEQLEALAAKKNRLFKRILIIDALIIPALIGLGFMFGWFD